MLAKGRQFHVGLRRSEHFQGFSAPGGVPTTLFNLAKEPASLDALKLFVGTAPAGNERLVFRGVHYDLVATQIPNITFNLFVWSVVWRATSPFPLAASHTVTAVYFTKE